MIFIRVLPYHLIALSKCFHVMDAIKHNFALRVPWSVLKKHVFVLSQLLWERVEDVQFLTLLFGRPVGKGRQVKLVEKTSFCLLGLLKGHGCSPDCYVLLLVEISERGTFWVHPSCGGTTYIINGNTFKHPSDLFRLVLDPPEDSLHKLLRLSNHPHVFSLNYFHIWWPT